VSLEKGTQILLFRR